MNFSALLLTPEGDRVPSAIVTGRGVIVPGDVHGSEPSPRSNTSARKHSWAARAARISGSAGLVVAWFGLAARFATARPLIVMAAGAFWLMLFAVPSAFLLAFVRSRVGLAIALVTVLAMVVVEAPLFIGSSPSARGPRVEVFTANLRLGLADPSGVLDDARRAGADVVLLQELTPSERVRLHDAGLDQRFPFNITDARATATGVGLWSRYPLRDATRHPGFGFALVSAQVEIPLASTAPTVVSAHMVAPWPQRPTRWLSDLARLEVLMTDLAELGPVIVGGDFNSTYDNRQYRSLATHGFHDAVDQSGAGFVPTFPANHWYPPLIEIDHVLARGAVAHSVHSMRVPGSDHRGLVVGLRLQARPAAGH